MENASKALIMAGGILIAILVMSLFVNGWNKITRFNKSKEEVQTAEQIIEFNKEYESYNKRIVRGYDLVSLKNLVDDTNERYSENDGFKKLELYIRFLKNTTLASNLGDNFIRKNQYFINNGVEINDFYSEYENKLKGSSDLAKIYKESYFQCDHMEYNGEDTVDGNARVQKMYFIQIDKK